eukprot:CAMPEP_0172664134 /NCGR_PEP_ID=MMETSP1074-20121228/6388_1 /TAXON_ID=2916 /ORGANISM="Ceratium fusus, Strain PA161109" /LENGTH=383 /DNA_ID=CAMNT_0013480231 /DNA_START=40 /DNA_END=1191 /DNA_ORIENTATION=-
MALAQLGLRNVLLVQLALTPGTDAQFTGSRLRITNACTSAPMWIAHNAHGTVGPDMQNTKIEALQSFDFLTPDGLSATRYWPKMFCDAEGNKCGLGGSGGPGEKCVGNGDYRVCAPPIDTKFEATFGQTGQPCDETSQLGCDNVDVSFVDGWTLPFRMEMNGECTTSNHGGTAPSVIDCQEMSFDNCPTNEFLSTLGQSVSLQAINSFTKSIAGCYSPCTKLIDDKWQNDFAQGRTSTDSAVSPYCCPGGPQGLSPEQCRAGPIKDTQYVQAVHTYCPGTYSYAYDDAMGLYKCNSATTYHVFFYCPSVMQTPTRSAVPQRPIWLWSLLILMVVLAVVGIVALIFGSRLWLAEYQQPSPHERVPRTQVHARGPQQGLIGGGFF